MNTIKLIPVDVDTIWSRTINTLPCFDLEKSTIASCIEWINNTRKRLNWKDPRIIVIGPKKKSPVESNDINLEVAKVGGLYYERSKDQTFNERLKEVEELLNAIRLKV